ncbi:MAG: PTS sugar transporter subunit IIA [Chlamydiales bacterium]|nr:PTS sugar transporter subunit IIA [Chlamydiales bacterium]
MDLKIKDVSELLNVAEPVIRRWVLEGKIPAYKLNRHYRFSRSEIEDWVMKNDLNKMDETHSDCILDEDLSEEDDVSDSSVGLQQYSLYRAVHKGGVYLDIEGETKEEIISTVTKILAKKFNWDADVVTELLIDREHLMPTALNNGIGVPHTRDFLLDTHFDVVAIVFLKKPIPYGALDGKPVHTLFFLFACEDKRHLHLLAKLAHLCSYPGGLQFLESRPSQQELLSYIKNWESSIKPAAH